MLEACVLRLAPALKLPWSTMQLDIVVCGTQNTSAGLHAKCTADWTAAPVVKSELHKYNVRLTLALWLP